MQVAREGKRISGKESKVTQPENKEGTDRLGRHYEQGGAREADQEQVGRNKVLETRRVKDKPHPHD